MSQNIVSKRAKLHPRPETHSEEVLTPHFSKKLRLSNPDNKNYDDVMIDLPPVTKFPVDQ